MSVEDLLAALGVKPSHNQVSREFEFSLDTIFQVLKHSCDT
jgi:hypothetical protein